MDSETYRRPAADQKWSAGGVRHRLPDTRYPHRFNSGADSAFEPYGIPAARSGETGSPETGGRVRTAMLIVFAVVALSAIAAIGWMQYQSRDSEDPQFEISEPDRSVPALAKAAGR